MPATPSAAGSIGELTPRRERRSSAGDRCRRGSSPSTGRTGSIGPLKKNSPTLFIGLRQGVAGTVVAPRDGTLRERHEQRVIGRLAGRAVLAVVGVVGDRPAAVVGAGRHARWHVLVDRHQQDSARAGTSSRRSRCRAPICRSTSRLACARVGVLQVALHRRQAEQRHRRHGRRQDVREDRRAGLAGREAMLR